MLSLKKSGYDQTEMWDSENTDCVQWGCVHSVPFKK